MSQHKATIERFPHLEVLPGGLWRTTRETVVSSTRAGLITIPEGYVTDLASVPRVPIAYWQTGGRARIPAIIHDWLYEKGRTDHDTITREVADLVFLDLMESMQDPRAGWRRRLMYWGVRVGGGFGWNRYRAAQGVI